MPDKRRVIGVAVRRVQDDVTGDLIVATCDDGAVFTYHDAPGVPAVWLELPPVPGTSRAAEVHGPR